MTIRASTYAAIASGSEDASDRLQRDLDEEHIAANTVEIRVSSLPRALAITFADVFVPDGTHPCAWPAGPYTPAIKEPRTRCWVSGADTAHLFESRVATGRHPRFRRPQ